MPAAKVVQGVRTVYNLWAASTITSSSVPQAVYTPRINILVCSKNVHLQPGLTDRCPVRCRDNYNQGADIAIPVENNLPSLRQFFLTGDPSDIRDKFLHSPTPGNITEGCSNSYPLDLEDAFTVDFARLIWVFYNRTYSFYDATIEEWISILKLAYQWNFIEVKELAVRELNNFKIPAVQKIGIFQKYEVDQNHIREAFMSLVVRNEPITFEEGRQLGLHAALSVARGRELVRMLPGGNITEIDALIQDVFPLSPDV
ncbi:hypothetical protein BGW80DRAFT_1250600 [Lactifluus volemus]|nr:hypothetical protein BGW80DRAFT_1250600 [Lactifluus volemus]